MAAPPEKTIYDLNGQWIMNKKLSGNTDAVLSLQGVSWFIRKTISFATVTLNHKHYKDDEGVEHIDIDQVITPGLQGTRELRTLNWSWREHSDIVFGEVRGRTRRVNLADVADDEDGRWMKEGWEPAFLEKGEAIETYVESTKKGWTANQFWGFEDVNGERRYTRHVIVKDKSGKKVLKLKLIYDWAGPLPDANGTTNGDTLKDETKEIEVKENGNNDNETKESEIKESETNESETNESKTNESKTKENETNESETKENETNESETNESETKESGTKENETNESETKENETKESETKENETKENETKENETKENETKESETKENETKENESKESGVKENGTKESE